jgi:SAM-dependent methyltransferase
MAVEDKLNLKYYGGTDLYSDGAVEDELLEAVQSKEKREELLKKSSDWAHLYHLSNIRENLLEWYDFDKNATLLEIGSGCGALSGLFCEKVSKVTAIELSKKRSLINATRNEEYDNLEIYVGNFEDIELNQKFDYVTMIGVFEYSICYISSENPFMEMLKRAKDYLKENGTLIIAIENKYGLKYFAGAREDHTGECFDGIQGYNGVDRVRTFSRKGIEQMLEAAGFKDNQFYYPIPDYKMPNEIYSDSYLPSQGSLRSTEFSYDRDRYVMFEESLVYDSLCNDDMFPEFANSFLIFCR